MTESHHSHEAAYRGEAVVAKRQNTYIVVLGVGAIGSKIINLLATQGYTKLLLVDMDRVEAKNFGTQDFGLRDVGRMKASQARANLFARLGVLKNVNAEDKKVTEGNIDRIVRGADLVLDCFDNHASRSMVKNFCSKIPCLHIGMSGDGFSEIEWNDNYRSHPSPEQPLDEAGNPCEYPLAANLVHLTVGLAAEVINKYVDEGIRQSVQFTLRDFHCDTNKR